MRRGILTAAVLAAVMTGCSSQGDSSSSEGTSHSAETTAPASAEPVTEPVTEEKTPAIAEGPLAEIREMNEQKIVFFLGDDLYCYTEQGGRDSSNFVLSRRSGDGFVPLEGGEDCYWRFSDGERIWGTRFSNDSGYCGNCICCTDGSKVTDVSGNIGNYLPYFTPEGVYFLEPENGETALMLMSYTGEISEKAVLNCGMPYSFQVYGGKLYCDRKNSSGVSIYDLSTGAYETADEIAQTEKEYSYDDEYVYREGTGGRERIFSAGEFCGGPGYYIGGIQVSGDQIYVDICSGAFYSRIVRLDGTGAYIDTIYISK